MSRNNDYKTGNLLDLAYFKSNSRLIAIDLGKKIKLKKPQQINFIAKAGEGGATMFFIIEKSEETTYKIYKCVHHIEMETIKIVNLLNDLNGKASKFAKKKWSITDSETKGDYSHENPTKFLTSSLESSLFNYSEAYILVTGGIAVTRTITAAGDNPIQRNQRSNAATQVAFKNCAPFKNYNTEINDTFVDEADFINVAVPMYSLIEYSDNHPDTSGSLWTFKRDEIASNANVTIDNDGSSLKYKASITGDTAADGKIDGVKIAVPLKCFSDFWRSLAMPLINCKV